MNKNDLVQAFSDVCAYIADNMHELIPPHLNGTDLMITPLFKNAHITNIDEWWNNDNHFENYLAQIAALRQDNPTSTQENMNVGVGEIQESEALYNQICAMDDGSSQSKIEILKHLPHNAQYATELTETDGYQKLSDACEKIGDIVVWPMVTVDPNAKDLKSAFYLNVALVSTDEMPLKQKIKPPRP